MSLFVWRYSLRSRGGLNPISIRRDHHPGALIRAGGGGVGCIHPWPELGDAPLDAQLATLAGGGTTPLIAGALRCAAIDGEARAAGCSAFAGLVIPASHQLLGVGDVPDPDFVLVKVKGGVVPETAAGQRLRFDFNGTLDRQGFQAWAGALPDAGRVDFVEDPFPFDREAWLACQAETGLALALDRGDKADWPGVVVVKPAVEPVPQPAGRRVIVTSYLDHPVGQMFAAYEAARLGTDETHGLMGHRLFERNPFGEQIMSEGNRLLPPAGTGLGFDDLIDALPWKRI